MACHSLSQIQLFPKDVLVYPGEPGEPRGARWVERSTAAEEVPRSRDSVSLFLAPF